MRKPLRWKRPIAIVAVLFGATSVYAGGMALFAGAAARAAVGDAVLPVLWFNFLAGPIYILGGAALWISSPKARIIALLIGLSTLVVFAILFVLALSGTPFEWRTIGAMVLRSGFWLAIANALSKTSEKKQT